MNVNENGKRPLVPFSELKPGDVFYRTGYDGGIENRYLMKIFPVPVKNGRSEDSEYTAVKLVTGGLSCIEDDRMVIPVNAELLVHNVGAYEEANLEKLREEPGKYSETLKSILEELERRRLYDDIHSREDERPAGQGSGGVL